MVRGSPQKNRPSLRKPCGRCSGQAEPGKNLLAGLLQTRLHGGPATARLAPYSPRRALGVGGGAERCLEGRQGLPRRKVEDSRLEGFG